MGRGCAAHAPLHVLAWAPLVGAVSESAVPVVAVTTPAALLLLSVMICVLCYSVRGCVIVGVGADVTESLDRSSSVKRYFLERAEILVGLAEGGKQPVPERVNTALQAHYSAWPQFLKIFWPGIFAAVTVPLVLLSRSSILLKAFPGTATLDHVDINEAVDCFLSPAGVVYAIFFGFVYKMAVLRQDEISALLASEASAVRHVLSMTFAMPDAVLSLEQKRFIATICRESLVEEVFEDVFGTGKTEIRAVFDSIDLDGNGTLDREEMDQAVVRLGLGLTKEEVDELMAEMDTDKDGTVDYGEFRAWEKQDARGLFKPLLRERTLPGMMALVPVLIAAQHTWLNKGGKRMDEGLRQILSTVQDNERILNLRRAELKRKTRPAQWAFLLILGIFTFTGVMMVSWQSETLNLLMSGVTALTIVCLMLFIADLDDITRGIFVVDMSVVAKAFLEANRHVIHYGGDIRQWHTAAEVSDRLDKEYLEAGLQKPASWRLAAWDTFRSVDLATE